MTCVWHCGALACVCVCNIRFLLTYKLFLVASKHLIGRVVSPSVPRERAGIYWGYGVRVANSLAEVFTGSPFKVVFRTDALCTTESKYLILQGGYDLVIGTSERGQSIDKVGSLPAFRWDHSPNSHFRCPKFSLFLQPCSGIVWRNSGVRVQPGVWREP